MKAILEFQLPEDTEEYEWAYNGGKYLTALRQIAEILRNSAKYREDDSTTYSEVRDQVMTIINREGIDLW